jgi:hypothetical protein
MFTLRTHRNGLSGSISIASAAVFGNRAKVQRLQATWASPSVGFLQVAHNGIAADMGSL